MVMSMSMNRPCHPVFWCFTDVGVDSGGFGIFGACMRMFTMKSVLYHACTADAWCFVPSNIDVDIVVAKRKAWEGIDVWEVIVPCERMDHWSEMERS